MDIVGELENIHQLLVDNNIKNWLDFRTLQYLYRDHTFPESMKKHSLGVPASFRKQLVELLYQTKVVFSWAQNGPHDSLMHIGPVEIYFWEYEKYRQFYYMTHPWLHGYQFRPYYVKSLSTIEFQEHVYTIPSSTGDFLLMRYGPLWTSNDKTDVQRVKGIITDLEWFHGFANKYNIEYWLDFGTLLGIYRDGEIIPWDYDCDVSAKAEDRPRIEQLLQDLGIEYTWANNGDSKSVLHLWHHIDIFFWNYDEENKLYYSDHGWCSKSQFPACHVEELGKLSFLGKEYLVPNDLDKFLELRYGEGWNVPDPDVNGKNRENNLD